MLSQMAGGEGGKECVLPSGSESGLLVLWSPVGRVGSFKQCSQSVSQCFRVILRNTSCLQSVIEETNSHPLLTRIYMAPGWFT
jgi:hypothetical protein